MKLILKNLLPQFIPDVSQSEIWGNEIIVSQGEHVHIVAPSGSGKTSLIHFIYGIRSDYGGSVLINNAEVKNLHSEKKAAIRQKHLSIIFQDLRLFSEETARKNIEIKRRLSPYHNADAINTMAQRLGIAHKLDQKAGTCSYGEQQRIAIIRSLMQPFDFLLLDEPYSHLDELNRQKAMELIYEECEKRNAAMVFADLKNIDLLKNEKTYYL